MSDELTYAIGDIHGRHDLLVPLLSPIESHVDGREHRLVFLGDYIDRGPDSAAVVATLREVQTRAPAHVVCLKGNHEALLLAAVADPHETELWVVNGGDATLRSYGVRSPAQIPGDVVAWMSGLPTLLEDSRHYYVHAGLRPGKTATETLEQDRIWIREPFLSRDADFGKHVVHGHTPVRTGVPDVRRHRTDLDTAAFAGGALTAGVFTAEADQAVEFIQVRAQR